MPRCGILRWITHGLGEEHTLLGSQLELLGGGLPIAVVEPGGQALRRRKQADIRRHETRRYIIIGLLDLRIADVSVWLPTSHVIASQIRNEEDIYRSRRRGPPSGPCAKVSRDHGSQTVSTAS